MTTNTTESTNNTHNQASNAQAQPPAAKFRFGPVHVSVWENTAPDGNTFYSARVERRYKPEGKDFQSSNSFTPDQILVVIELLHQANAAIEELKLARGADPVTGELNAA